MSTKMDSLLKNQMWDLVPQPRGKNIVKYCWVYKTKFTFDDVVEHHKARLVLKRFSQSEGIDYTETFVAVVTMNCIQFILSLACFEW